MNTWKFYSYKTSFHLYYPLTHTLPLSLVFHSKWDFLTIYPLILCLYLLPVLAYHCKLPKTELPCLFDLYSFKKQKKKKTHLLFLLEEKHNQNKKAKLLRAVWPTWWVCRNRRAQSQCGSTATQSPWVHSCFVCPQPTHVCKFVGLWQHAAGNTLTSLI